MWVPLSLSLSPSLLLLFPFYWFHCLSSSPLSPSVSLLQSHSPGVSSSPPVLPSFPKAGPDRESGVDKPHSKLLEERLPRPLAYHSHWGDQPLTHQRAGRQTESHLEIPPPSFSLLQCCSLWLSNWEVKSWVSLKCSREFIYFTAGIVYPAQAARKFWASRHWEVTDDCCALVIPLWLQLTLLLEPSVGESHALASLLIWVFRWCTAGTSALPTALPGNIAFPDLDTSSNFERNLSDIYCLETPRWSFALMAQPSDSTLDLFWQQ